MKKEKSQKLAVSATHLPDFMRTLAHSIQFGIPLLVEIASAEGNLGIYFIFFLSFFIPSLELVASTSTSFSEETEVGKKNGTKRSLIPNWE